MALVVEARIVKLGGHRHRRRQNVTGIGNGDWVQFQNVNFGTSAATQFNGRFGH